MSDGQLWFIAFCLIIAFIIFLNSRSAMFAEEVRKTLIVNELPISKGKMGKLFTKKRARKYNNRHPGRSSIDFDDFNEFSPLKIMGYAVGKSGLNFEERKHVLHLAIFGNFQLYMPDGVDFNYSWGSPGSRERFGSVFTHIRRVKNLRLHRRNMGSAIDDWNNDLRWIGAKKSKVYHFRIFRPRGVQG